MFEGSPKKDLASEVASISQWYHTIELAPGVTTPGWHDTRSIVNQVPFPASLNGMRCLDVGTFDGFWAFEMESRGASEVVAIDVPDPKDWDWPVGSSDDAFRAISERKGEGRGFDVAARALGSSVRRLERSIYDLNESEVGTFDLVYLGSLLVHLRDPVRALERVRDVCRGSLIVVDGIDLFLSLVLSKLPVATLDGLGRPWWWYPNIAGLQRLVEAAGFRIIEKPRRLFMPPGAGQPLARTSLKHFTTREGRRTLVIAQRGDPHAALVAQPIS